MNKLLKLYGLFFLVTTVVAVTNADKKLLDKNEEKVAQIRQLKSMWNAM